MGPISDTAGKRSSAEGVKLIKALRNDSSNSPLDDDDN